MANGNCPNCRRGSMVAHVCYDECSECGYIVARPGCVHFRELADGDQFLAGYDLLDAATPLTKGTPPGWLTQTGQIDPNAYNLEIGRYVAFGPAAAVRKL